MDRKTNSPAGGDAWGTALRLLTRRDYGTEELRRRLLGAGFPAAAVEQAVARGSELGYLDDARLVERLAQTLLAQGRAAGPRLTLELRRRGFPAELIDAAVAAGRDRGDEEASLRTLIAMRFAAFDFAAAGQSERRRVIAYLQRRGFPLDRILNELKRTDS